MSRKQAKHLFETNLFGIKEKIKNFQKPRKTIKKKGSVTTAPKV
jgi:hypothetical protein